ncbi:MAG: hypothetical protein V1926_02700 [Candidatus Peregrinibacteria bacterium]
MPRTFINIGLLSLGALSMVACSRVSTLPSGENGTAESVSSQVSLQKLTRAILDESLGLGKSFLLANQKKEGNFNYQYDFVEKTFSADDNQVRQVGPLWGLSLIHQDSQSEETRSALLKGFTFFKRYSVAAAGGGRFVAYPGAANGETGTIALLSLALTEFLRTEPSAPEAAEIKADLDQYIAFLLTLRRPDGCFASEFALTDGTPSGDPSPYFDGETLLALSKAVRSLGHSDLLPTILGSAECMYQRYEEEPLKNEPDPALAKSFYQWGTMAFYEIAQTGGASAALYRDRAIAMADWIIDGHDILSCTRNTGYAYEGLIHAFELARQKGDRDAQKKFAGVIDQGLWKLTRWQVSHSAQNKFLQGHPTKDPLAVGGIMNKNDEPLLRIDITQHQMHAVVLARRFVVR